MKSLPIALMFIALLTAQTVATAQKANWYSVSMPGGLQQRLEAQHIGGRDYLALPDIAQKLFPGSTMHPGTGIVDLPAGRLLCAAANFFVLLETERGTSMGQMPIPALSIRGTIYLPARYFFQVVHTLELYRVNSRGEDMRSYEFEPPVMARGASSPLVFGDLEFDNDGRIITTGADMPAQSTEPVATAPNDKPEQKAGMRGAAREMLNGLHSRAGEDWERETFIDADALSGRQAEREHVPNNTIVPNRYRLPDDLKRDETLVRPQTREAVKQGSPTRAQGRENTVPPRRNYVIPDDLQRDEEVRPDSSQSGYLDSLSRTAPLLASLLDPELLAEASASPTITSIELEESGTSVRIICRADQAITDYQKPENSGRRLILRFPNALNAFEGFDKIKSNPQIEDAYGELIRNIQVYRFRFKVPIQAVAHKRLSAATIEFRVELAATEPVETESSEEKIARESEKWKLDVIVLDPGHGGKDPGAIGISGVKEKDITLSLAMEVGALLTKELPGVKVVYTREDDRFIELYRRGQIANEAGGKLFISIHANSLPSKPQTARGYETYILRPGRNEDAVKVAERENSAVRFEENSAERYRSLNEEEFIIINMAQKAFVKLSERFASILQEEIGKSTILKSRGVKAAGFFVLVGASMPNVLFETAFLSNKADEQYVQSEKGQKAIAEGMVKAIKRYVEQYEELAAEGQ